VAGTYNGLIHGVSGPAANGSITLALQRTGAFSAMLTMDGQVFNATGALDTTGQASFGANRSTTLVLNRAGKPPINVDFWLDLYEGARLAGVATQNGGAGVTITSSIEADRAVFDGVTRLVPPQYLGAANANAIYTSVLGLSPTQGYLNLDAAHAPQGFSYATITVSKSGTVLFVGTLSDNTSVVASSTLTQRLSQALTCPLFVPLYDMKGFLISMLQFDVTQHESDMTGSETVWSRPALPNTAYPGGWTEGLFMDCVAARYVVTAGQSSLLMPDGFLKPDDADDRGDTLPPPNSDGNAELKFTAAALQTVTRAVNITTADILTKLLPPGNANGIGNGKGNDKIQDKTFSLSISRDSGLVSGDFTHPVLGTNPAFQGIFYQKGSVPGAFGFFPTKTPIPSDPDHGFGAMALKGKP
jgi:hypothetical protein